MQLMFLVARSKWAQGTVSNSSDMLALMGEISATGLLIHTPGAWLRKTNAVWAIAG